MRRVVFPLPPVEESLTPPVAGPPLQLIACELAVALGRDAGRRGNRALSVAVE